MTQWVAVQSTGAIAEFNGYAHKECVGEFRVQGKDVVTKRVFFGERKGLECVQCVELDKAELAMRVGR